jgi:hypothetical protein
MLQIATLIAAVLLLGGAGGAGTTDRHDTTDNHAVTGGTL